MNARSIRFRTALWYSGVLAASLTLSGLSVYVGLKQYLDWALKSSLLDQARSIGEKLLVDVERKGEQYVVAEIGEHYSPEISNRFIRVLRPDGTALYLSSTPKDHSFDPLKIPAEGLLTTERERRLRLGGGSSLIIEAVRYTSPGGQRFQIEVGESYGQIHTVLRGLLVTFALGMPVLLAIAIAGGFLVMRYALRPLAEIADQAERISSRNMAERLPVVKTGDELERLSLSLNRMMSRLEESFDHVSRFSADVSHELRTPLTILRGELEALTQDKRLHFQLAESTGSALEEVERMSSIVENLLAISCLDAGKAILVLGSVDLGTLAVSTAEQMRLLADEKSVSIRYRIAKGVQVVGDSARLRQVIVNLLNNALTYTADGGRVEITVEREKDTGVLQISDNGTGISSESLPFVFGRFYRSDKARSRNSGGAGLGLAIVKAICTAHKGEVAISSVEGQGTSVRVLLPLAEKNAEPARETLTSSLAEEMTTINRG
jgi:heavy metal sensor kinase